MITGPMFVLQTWFVPHQHPVHVYRIECGQAMQVPVISDRDVFITSDPDLFADALDCEGHPVQVIVIWHQEGRAKVVDRLALAEGWREGQKTHA